MFPTQGFYVGHAGPVPLYVSPSALFLPVLCWMWSGGDLKVFVALVLVLVVSIVLHALGHAGAALLCRQRDVAIALHALGGVCMHPPTASPRQQVLITAAGPLVTLALAGLAWVTYPLLDGLMPGWEVGHSGYLSNLGLVVFLFLWINVILAIFNLLPIYPLDGGQILLTAQRSFGVRGDTAARVTLAVTIATAVLVLVVMHRMGRSPGFTVFLLFILVMEAFTVLGRPRR